MLQKIKHALIVFSVFGMLCSGCKVVSYSFTGADVPAEAKTFSVEYLQNAAPLANATYSQKITEKLKDHLLSQTSLGLTKSNGDLQFSGSVVQYEVTPAATQANEQAGLNKFTIGVKITYVNSFDDKKNIEQVFSHSEFFPANANFSSIESEYIERINTKLVQLIFNATLGNW